MRLVIIIIALLAVSGFVVVQYDQVNFNTGEITAEVNDLAEASLDDEAFLKATKITPFEFPADHGPHPDYRAEWWYYTGNLADAEGNRFGYIRRNRGLWTISWMMVLSG